MTARTATPLTAALGLVAVTAEGVRRLPGLLAELPPAVVRQLEETRQAARQRYTELAMHGQDVLAGRHPAPDRTDPDALTELLDEVAPPRPAESAAPAEPAVPATPPAPVPPPRLTEPVQLPEDVLEEVAQLTPGAELPHAELPLEDFDHLTVPQLRGRLRTLELPELVQLRDYEQAHAARLPVLTLLDNRIAKLTAGDPAE